VNSTRACRPGCERSNHEPRSECLYSGARKAAILFSLLGEDAGCPGLPEPSRGQICSGLPKRSQTWDRSHSKLAWKSKRIPADDLRSGIHRGGRAGRCKPPADQSFRRKWRQEHACKKLTRAGELSSSGVESLKKADPQQLARFLVGEHSQTKALVLGHLDPKQASALLMRLEPEARVDCVKRLASLGHNSLRT
jgi:hypothetical protein